MGTPVSFTKDEELWLAAHPTYVSRVAVVESAKALVDKAKRRHDGDPVDFFNQVHTARLALQAAEIDLEGAKRAVLETFDQKAFEPSE